MSLLIYPIDLAFCSSPCFPYLGDQSVLLFLCPCNRVTPFICSFPSPRSVLSLSCDQTHCQSETRFAQPLVMPSFLTISISQLPASEITLFTLHDSCYTKDIFSNPLPDRFTSSSLVPTRSLQTHFPSSQLLLQRSSHAHMHSHDPIYSTILPL